MAHKVEQNEEESCSLSSRESMFHNLRCNKHHLSADDFTYVLGFTLQICYICTLLSVLFQMSYTC